MNYPKISIVTPSFKQGKYLEQTILSIIDQQYPNLEYIIIDGGSTDNSVEIVKKYEKHLTYWISEKDKGQSDAINKGLNKATGELFNWINSDDLLEPGSLLKIAETYQQNPSKKIFSFGLNYLKGDKKELFDLRNNPEDRLQCFCDPVISQPATFFSLKDLKPLGGVNITLHYSMDYELWLRFMFAYSESSILVDKTKIASFRLHDQAKTAEGNANFVNDMASVLYSLSGKAGLKKYHQMLDETFTVRKQYEFVCPSERIDEKLVERMVVYFLLKWKKNVYSKNDFTSVKNILKKIRFDSMTLSGKEKDWLKTMKENANYTSWLEFRAKRKIRHILK